MAKYLLDTTALIDHLRGRKEVVDLMTSLAQEGHVLGTCAVNVAEVHAGLREAERGRADRLLDRLELYQLSRAVATLAGRYRYESARRGVTIAITDALIAGAAVKEGATLITANVRDFPMGDLRVQQQP